MKSQKNTSSDSLLRAGWKTRWWQCAGWLMFMTLLELAMAPLGRAETPDEAERLARLRARMVADQIEARGVKDQRVLNAMRKVPRHVFVPPDQRPVAYQDSPLPIGKNQTISQPFIVAWMTELARARPGVKALDVGTGSGYQAAVLAEIVGRVYSIEIICDLADAARARLTAMGYDNVEVRCGDGSLGWPEHAPYDVIIAAAAPEQVPQALLAQLAPGGRLVIPVGEGYQDLMVYTKAADGHVSRDNVGAVRFVPMTGKARGSVGIQGESP